MSRHHDVRRIEALMSGVRAGRSHSLVVLGPAGIGKSWLCGRACALADGFTVVRTRGTESEAHLGYGGLFDVLSPLLEGRVERLLGARGDALRGALRMASPVVVDPFAVALASLDLLAMAAEDAPVLVVVDDAPWVDTASLVALRFAARRLEADRVGFLFAARSDSAAPFVDAEVESLTVGGLDTAEALELVREFAGAHVAEPVALALAVAGRDDPLWLREAARELSSEQMSGAAPLSARGSVQEAFARLAAGLTAPERQALVVLSADERAPEAVMERALRGTAIEAGIAAGLVRREGGRLRFSHPLAQAAAVEVATTEQRRWAHDALARAWDQAEEPERAAWHLAEGGDAGAAAALVATARAARARGAPGEAAEAWRRAIETADVPPPPLQLERARDLAQAGRAVEALVELDQILTDGCAADLRADAEILQGQLLISQGRIAQAAGVMEAGAARIRDTDPARAVVMLCAVAGAKSNRAELAAAVTIAEAAVALAEPLGGTTAAAAESTLAWILIIAGEGARGLPLLLRHPYSGDATGRAPSGEFVPARRGMFACWMEDYETARRELEGAVVIARERGLINHLPLALSGLGDLEFRVGNWIAARSLCEEALRLARDAEQFLHFAHIQLMLLAAVSGDSNGAREYAEIVSTVAARSGSLALAIHAHAGLGLLELGLDDPQAAIVHASRAREIAAIGIEEPNYVRWAGDLVESQIRAGLEADARETLAAFEAQARRTGRGWALAAAARCRGLLAAPAEVDAVFGEAHRLVCAQPSPFERARTELCWGERLRRDGRRVEARRQLHDAHARFVALGAVPWAEKAARELRSSGGRALRGPRARGAELTAQETQIAALVAEGQTNRGIANSLFLSPKTIEFHLGHIYRKLEVNNRTQLARALLTR